MQAINPHFKIAMIVLSTLAFVGGCAFVSLDPEAEDVKVLEADRVNDCERLGQTQVTSAHRIGFIPRSDRAIENDLDRLARNSAADMGGDTAVRKTDITEGTATYEVFDCVR